MDLDGDIVMTDPVGSDEDVLMEDADLALRTSVPPTEFVFRIAGVASITAEHDAIHQTSFGMLASTSYNNPSGIRRIVPSAVAEATMKAVIECRSRDGRLIGFFIAASNPGDISVDIWSVCKNNAIEATGVFEFLLNKFIATYPLVQNIYLVASSVNSTAMTEVGRLALYSSLGFRIVPNTPVTLTYPEDTAVVAYQPDHNMVVFYGATKPSDAVYICFIKHSGNDIAMVATRTAILAGRQKLAHEGYKDVLFERNAALQIQISPMKPKYNEFKKITTLPTHVYTSIYHQALISLPNGILSTFTLPANVTLVQFSMPGAILLGTKSKFLNLVDTILPNYINFINDFPGYKKLPFPALPTHADFIRGMGDIYRATLLASIFMANFERREILELCNAASMVSGVFRGFYDIQSYDPGMTVLDSTMAYDPNSQLDAQHGIGLYYTIQGVSYSVDSAIQAGRLSPVAATIRNSPAKPGGVGGTTLQAYVNAISAVHPREQIVLFSFGCAAVVDFAGYSLFYELAHRRSIRYRVTDSDINENILPYIMGLEDVPSNQVGPCARQARVPGGSRPGKTYRRKMKKKRSTRKFI